VYAYVPVIFAGVNCMSIEEGYKCGPCPDGLLGDGQTCAPPRFFYSFIVHLKP
jgi:hypothetical protein